MSNPNVKWGRRIVPPAALLLALGITSCTSSGNSVPTTEPTITASSAPSPFCDFRDGITKFG